jgi:hypothetical protein
MNTLELETAGLRLVAQHIDKVRHHMTNMIVNLLNRASSHDQSKYSTEEIGLVVGKPAFDKYEYMSQEERDELANVKDALVHHYARNSHHPEHYTNGTTDMSLFDLLEMCADWKAAGEMSPAGDFSMSLKINTQRFSLSPELVKILENTAREMDWIV